MSRNIKILITLSLLQNVIFKMKYSKLILLIGLTIVSFSCKKEDANKSDNQETNENDSNYDCSYENDNVSKTVDCNVQLNMTSLFSEITSNDKRIFTVNNIPSHLVGEYPNNANPHSISAQEETIEISINPQKKTSLTPLQNSNGPAYAFGICLNGVEMDPVAAEPWGKNTTNENYNWNLEATANNLGLDCSNAHVQPTGSYHYHGTPVKYIESLNTSGNEMVLMGWAADGFPVYYSFGYSTANDSLSAIKTLTSSYRLKSGDRPGDGISAPCGEYNGKYVQDYEFTEGLGDLDEANGRTGVTPEFPNGTYYYVVTDEFPGIPRYFAGDPSKDFKLGPGK